MRLLKHVFRLAVSAILSATALSPGGSPGTDNTRFASYFPLRPPQQAQGDFDGDGRIDTAQILERAGAARLSIQLSGSSAAIDLEPAVVAVVQGDVDQDGDLDLVAATSAGGLLIWLNDGHGRFARQPESPTTGLSREATATEAASHPELAVDLPAPSLPVPARRHIDLVVATAPCSTSPPADDAFDVILPPLRAPPRRAA